MLKILGVLSRPAALRGGPYPALERRQGPAKSRRRFFAWRLHDGANENARSIPRRSGSRNTLFFHARNSHVGPSWSPASRASGESRCQPHEKLHFGRS